MEAADAGMQPPHKRRRAPQEQDPRAGLGSGGRVDMDRSTSSASSGGSFGSGGSELDAIPLDFFAELDDWLDDSPLLLPDGLLRGTEAAGVLSGGSQAFSGLTSSAAVKEQQQQPPQLGGCKSATFRPTAKSTRLARPKPKSSTQRQKEEMAYLRRKVVELEARLHDLHLDRNQPGGAAEDANDALSSHSNNTREPTMGSTCTEGSGLWESIAVHQREVRREAEKERERLQSMLKTQVKFLRRLENMLHKSKAWEQLQETQWRKSGPATRADSEIFNELLRSVDARYALMETMLDIKGLNHSCHPMNDIKLSSVSSDGLCVEFKLVKLLPFDFRFVIDMMWRCLRQGKIAMFNLPSTIIEHSPDVTLIKSTLERPPLLTQPATAYRVVKRFVETDCARVIVEIELASKRSPESKFPPVKVVLQGWGRITPTKLSDGSPSTVIQGFVTSVLTILDSEGDSYPQEPRRREIDMLSELILSGFQDKLMLVQRELETVLIDATLARKSPVHL